VGGLPERRVYLFEVFYLAQSFQDEEGGAAARGFFDLRDGDGAAQGVGHYLAPGWGVQHAAAGGDHVALAGERAFEDLGYEREPQGHRFHRRSQDLLGLRSHREAGDDPAGALGPPGPRSPARSGRKVSPCASGRIAATAFSASSSSGA
jgi:hypothetical protein